MENNILNIENITKVYSDKTTRTVALDNISFSVEKGDIFAVLGPNGAGKTTLIKILLNLIFAQNGKAEIQGISVLKSESRKNIGYVPENVEFPDDDTPMKFLKNIGRISGISKDNIQSQVKRVIDDFGLKEENKRISILSKGNKQRVNLAQGFIHQPDLVILDEPADGLDPIERNKLINYLIRYRNNGGTIFVCSHILSDIEKLCNRFIILDKGKIKHIGNVDKDFENNQYILTINNKSIDENHLKDFKSYNDKTELQFTHIECKNYSSFVQASSILQNNNIHIETINVPNSKLEKIYIKHINML